MQIGVDRAADAQRFHVTEKGVVLVTAGHAAQACRQPRHELTRRLPVVLLWHMHQPQYRDALTGQYVLPWTYLHAIKDYTDMAAHLEANPAARAVVNFTPVLLEQLEELARRIAEHLHTGSAAAGSGAALLGPDPVPQEPARAARAAAVPACVRSASR